MGLLLGLEMDIYKAKITLNLRLLALDSQELSQFDEDFDSENDESSRVEELSNIF